jgi:hypothetical protein
MAERLIENLQGTEERRVSDGTMAEYRGRIDMLQGQAIAGELDGRRVKGIPKTGPRS